MQEQDHWLRGQCAAREAGAPEAPRDGQQQQEARDGRFWQVRLRLLGCRADRSCCCPAIHTCLPCHGPAQAVCLLVRQFDGLKAGYRARRAELAAAGNGGAAGHMSDWDFLFLESSGAAGFLHNSWSVLRSSIVHAH